MDNRSRTLNRRIWLPWKVALLALLPLDPIKTAQKLPVPNPLLAASGAQLRLDPPGKRKSVSQKKEKQPNSLLLRSLSFLKMIG